MIFLIATQFQLSLGVSSELSRKLLLTEGYMLCYCFIAWRNGFILLNGCVLMAPEDGLLFHEMNVSIAQSCTLMTYLIMDVID